MTIPELPEPTLETNGDVFGHENVQGFTSDQMRDYAEACYLAGMERAAVIAEDTIEAEYEGVDRYGENCAAAIRAEAAKEAK